MATLHTQGRSWRARTMAVAEYYMIFSENGTFTESEVFSVAGDAANFLGARRASQVRLVQLNSANGLIQVGTGAGLKQYDGYSPDDFWGANGLAAKLVRKLLVEAYLTNQVVGMDTTKSVGGVYVVSRMEGIGSSGSEFLTKAQLGGSGVRYVVEAVHKLSPAIPIVVDLDRKIQIVLEA